MNISPCVYPGCDDGSGNPTLTTNGMCDHCRRRYRRLLDRIVIDYVTIRATMPKGPVTTDADTRQAPRGSREPGHPAQWASDTARRIADTLDDISEGLRDHLTHLPPPPRSNAEGRRVDHAHATLVARLDDLCTYPGARASAVELVTLHGQVRWALGHGGARRALPTPCPDCGIFPVFRTVRMDRSDTIECDACGRVIRDVEYGLYTRMIVDDLISRADAEAASDTPDNTRT